MNGAIAAVSRARTVTPVWLCAKSAYLALVNNVVSAGMSGLLFETSFEHRVELMTLDKRPFSSEVIVIPSFIFSVSSD